MTTATRSKPAATVARRRAPERARVETLSHAVRQALFETLSRALLPTGDRQVLTVERAAKPSAPERLASLHPGSAKERADARVMYERCLAHYRQEVRAQDAASDRDDVGAAIAYFVAANLRALHDMAVSPSMLLTLEGQLAGLPLRNPSWDEAPARERQAYFEQVAILGVLVCETYALAHQQGEAAIANVRRAAYGYLQQMLGLNPLCLSLDDQGLRLRETHGRRPAEPTLAAR